MITIALLKTYSTFPTAERYPKKFSFVTQSRQYADQLILNFSQLSGIGTDGTVGTVGTSGVCDGKSKTVFSAIRLPSALCGAESRRFRKIIRYRKPTISYAFNYSADTTEKAEDTKHNESERD